MDDTADNLELSRLRFADVLDPDSIARKAGFKNLAISLDGNCLAVYLPTSLFRAFTAPGVPVHRRFNVAEVPDTGERFIFYVLQVGGAQLRLLMPVGEPDVQQYLLDCLGRGRIRLLLADDDSDKLDFVDIPGGFRKPDLVQQLLSESQVAKSDAKRLLELASALCPVASFPSLHSANEVTNSATVLVINKRMEAELQDGPVIVRRRGTPLH